MSSIIEAFELAVSDLDAGSSRRLLSRFAMEPLYRRWDGYPTSARPGACSFFLGVLAGGKQVAAIKTTGYYRSILYPRYEQHDAEHFKATLKDWASSVRNRIGRPGTRASHGRRQDLP